MAMSNNRFQILPPHSIGEPLLMIGSVLKIANKLIPEGTCNDNKRWLRLEECFDFFTNTFF